MLGIALVPAVASALSVEASPLANWAGRLAYLGYAIYGLSQVRAMALFPVLGQLYAEPGASAATRDAVVVGNGLVNVDPTATLSLGLIGFWIAVTSLVALRSGTWPRILTAVGIADGLFLGLFVIGITLGNMMLVDIVAGLAIGVLPVIWYIWVGRILRREPETTPALARAS